MLGNAHSHKAKQYFKISSFDSMSKTAWLGKETGCCFLVIRIASKPVKRTLYGGEAGAGVQQVRNYLLVGSLCERFRVAIRLPWRANRHEPKAD